MATAGWLAALTAVALWAAAGPAPTAATATATLWLLWGAPLCEEIVFRAGLQEALLRRWPAAHPAWAIAVTALLFAAAHVGARLGASGAVGPGTTWGAALVAGATALPALALGVLYQRQRHWLPCAALHALFNLIWLWGSPPLSARLF